MAKSFERLLSNGESVPKSQFTAGLLSLENLVSLNRLIFNQLNIMISKLNVDKKA